MKHTLINYEIYAPPARENYDDVDYIVEDDPTLQPAVALQAAIARYGQAALLKGYMSNDVMINLSTPVYEDIHSSIDRTRQLSRDIASAQEETRLRLQEQAVKEFEQKQKENKIDDKSSAMNTAPSVSVNDS